MLVWLIYFLAEWTYYFTCDPPFSQSISGIQCKYPFGIFLIIAYHSLPGYFYLLPSQPLIHFFNTILFCLQTFCNLQALFFQPHSCLHGFLTIQEAWFALISHGLLPLMYKVCTEIIHNLSFFLLNSHRCFSRAALFHTYLSVILSPPATFI